MGRHWLMVTEWGAGAGRFWKWCNHCADKVLGMVTEVGDEVKQSGRQDLRRRKV